MQTAPDRPEGFPMDSHTLLCDPETLLDRQGLSRQRVSYCCPHCSKGYRTSTWLDNHIKTKHSARDAQELSLSLAGMIHNRRSLVNSASQLPQSLAEEDLHHFTLIRELQATVPLLNSLLTRIDDVVARLQEPNGAPPRARPTDQGPLRDLKRRISSQDLHGQNKRQGISTSVSSLPIPQTRDPILFNDFESQNPSPVPTPCNGDHVGLYSSKDSQDFARYSSFEQIQGVCLPLSQKTTPPSQPPANGLSPRQRKTRRSRAPKTQNSKGNATGMFQAFPRQQQGRLSPREQLAAHPPGTSPARLTPEYTPPEQMEHMANTPLQKSLDLLSHEPGQRFSPLGELQQSLGYLDPTSQHDIGDDFGQTPQQYDFGNGLCLDQSDFLTLPMQPKEAWEEKSH